MIEKIIKDALLDGLLEKIRLVDQKKLENDKVLFSLNRALEECVNIKGANAKGSYKFAFEVDSEIEKRNTLKKMIEDFEEIFNETLLLYMFGNDRFEKIIQKTNVKSVEDRFFDLFSLEVEISAFKLESI
jgi:hypothetical protein